ncbi:AMP-binding protein [Amycolatopsis jejuensis]|uniref:AMP-binding protein n=1 Tax=Amycolatopsis jejuensis TaxID=330084 RepID=UPI0009FD15DB|nr:AMP-binding protein [Amycolatopsis jejuensis]
MTQDALIPLPAKAPLRVRLSTADTRVRFAQELALPGNRPAIIADGTTVSYLELDHHVSELAAKLGTTRRLVQLEARNDLATVIGYLAALRGGHPVLLTAAESLTAHYDPDVILRNGDIDVRRRGTRHTLHPELALLLSTSGSTGSPKLVRLGATGVQANAEAIARYLGIRPGDRAALSLPLHYCYGLSVLASNLAAGAAVVLTERSVVDPGFWTTLREHRATSLHGVPHTFALLDQIGFDEHTAPHLRYVTQAGGRLAPETVRRYARMARRGGWQFFVMYGQTEATARMAYLPPELAETHPGAIGTPIDGGSFTIAGPDASGTGELVYRGPNTMLGYARHPHDLARGRTIDALATGDLARRTPAGLYEIVGRKSRFGKPFGHRIDLDEIEHLLSHHGFTAACTGDDEVLNVFVTADAEQAHEIVRAKTGLPSPSIRPHLIDRIPRHPNGKIDYPALHGSATDPRPATSVRSAFRKVLPQHDITGDDTFTGLGGDSLSYVRMSIELEAVLGHLPPSWPTMTVQELESRRTPATRLAHLDTGIALRAVAILLVVGTHLGAYHLLGGAHLLLAVSGWAFARFTLAPANGPSGRLLRSAAAIALPAMAWITWRATVSDTVGTANILLVNNLVHTAPATGYWYVEVLVLLLLILAAVFAIPAVRRFERRHGFSTAAAMLAVALIAAMAWPGWFSLPGSAWFFALGWLVYRATTPARKLLVAAAILTLVPGFFADPGRETIVIAGLFLLLATVRLPVPRALVRPAGLIADASLAIYLTHYAVFPFLLTYLPPALTLLACVALGITLRQSLRQAARLVRHSRR